MGARGGSLRERDRFRLSVDIAPRYEALRMEHIRGARALAADASDECAPSCAQSQFGKLCSRVLATMHQCDWGVTDDAPLRAYWELSDEVCLGRTVPDARTAFLLQEEVRSRQQQRIPSSITSSLHPPTSCLITSSLHPPTSCLLAFNNHAQGPTSN